MSTDPRRMLLGSSHRRGRERKARRRRERIKYEREEEGKQKEEQEGGEIAESGRPADDRVS